MSNEQTAENDAPAKPIERPGAVVSGCCDACGGGGAAHDGPCWDCRGTGHPHKPDPTCVTPPALTDGGGGPMSPDAIREVLAHYVAGNPECRYCHDAIHDGDCCIECWRDLRELDNARNKEWWS